MHRFNRVSDKLASLILPAVLVIIMIIVILAVTGPPIGNIFSNIVMSERWCTWTATARSWLDQNEDGIWDSQEPPLPDVEFSFARQQRVSDWKGEGTGSVNAESACSPNATFDVLAKPPPGYRFTTEDHFVAHGQHDTGPFLFGFTYLSEKIPTVTPRPPSPRCTTYLRELQGSSDIAIAPDNTVWVSINGGNVHQYQPDQDTWRSYTTANGLISSQTSAIAVALDNSVWVSTREGAARFDGSSWTSFTVKDGLASNELVNVAASPDGTVWFVMSGHGIARYDPRANTWTNYTAQDGVADDWTWSITAASDSSVWLGYLGTSLGMSGWIPSSADDSPNWTTYSTSPIDPVIEIVVAPNNTLWFAGRGGVGHLDPVTGQMKFHEYPDTLMSLAIAPDDSLWIGTNSRGLKHLIPADDKGNDIWEIYTTQDGLPDNYVTSVKVASDGTLWLGTFRGIARCFVGSYNDTR